MSKKKGKLRAVIYVVFCVIALIGGAFQAVGLISGMMDVTPSGEWVYKLVIPSLIIMVVMFTGGYIVAPRDKSWIVFYLVSSVPIGLVSLIMIPPLALVLFPLLFVTVGLTSFCGHEFSMRKLRGRA